MWNIAWEKSFKIMYFTASFSSSLVQNEDEMVFASYSSFDAHKQTYPWFKIRVKSFQRTLFFSFGVNSSYCSIVSHTLGVFVLWVE